jgi:hypothetical protein
LTNLLSYDIIQVSNGKEIFIMIKILTDDVELLKDACKSLAYSLIMTSGEAFRFTVSADEIADCLRDEGLKVEVEK